LGGLYFYSVKIEGN